MFNCISNSIIELLVVEHQNFFQFLFLQNFKAGTLEKLQLSSYKRKRIFSYRYNVIVVQGIAYDVRTYLRVLDHFEDKTTILFRSTYSSVYLLNFSNQYSSMRVNITHFFKNKTVFF